MTSDLRSSESHAQHPFLLLQQCSTECETELAPRIAHEIENTMNNKKLSQVSILDIGCGDCKVMLEVGKRLGKCGNAISFYGYEHDATMLIDSRDRVAELKQLPHIRCATIFECEFNLQSQCEPKIDVVIFSHSLYGYSGHEKGDLIEHAMKISTATRVIVAQRVGSFDYGTIFKAGFERQQYTAEISFAGLSLQDKATLQRYAKCPGEFINGTYPQQVQFITASLVHARKDESRQVNFFCRAAFEKYQLIETIDKTSMDDLLANGRDAFFRFIPSSEAELCMLMCRVNANAIKIAVIGGGHSHYSVHQNANVLIDMSAFRDCRLLESAEAADDAFIVIGGGCTSQDIINVAKQHGVLMPLGDRPSVGLGLILQGGIGLYTRTLGMACDNVASVKFWSLRESRIIEVGGTDPLLWGFRGGGNRFGPVVEIKLKGKRGFAGMWLTQKLFSNGLHQDLCDYAERSEALPLSSAEEACLVWKNECELVLMTGKLDLMFRSQGNHHLHQETNSNSIDPHAGPTTVRAKTFFQHQDDLYGNELFSHPDLFSPERFTKKGHAKLRCHKRCIFLDELPVDLLTTAMKELKELQGSKAMRSSPLHCYIHLLPGPGSDHVAGESNDVIFGKACRAEMAWKYAAVITGMASEHDITTSQEPASFEWVDRWTQHILDAMPKSTMYVTDLGPDDPQELVNRAFYSSLQNAFQDRRVLANLQKLVHEHDPRQQVVSACRLPDGTITDTIYVVVCGRRCAGKDFWAENITNMLNASSQDKFAEVRSISSAIKIQYAHEYGLDAHRLIHDQTYRDKHRANLQRYYEKCKSQDANYGGNCLLSLLQEENGKASPQLVFVTGVRDGIPFVKDLQQYELYRKSLVLVKVIADETTKLKRGWCYDSEIDDGAMERACEIVASGVGDSYWDLVVDTSNEGSEVRPRSQIFEMLFPVLIERCCLRVSPTIIGDKKIDFVCVESLLESTVARRFTVESLAWGVQNFLSQNTQDERAPIYDDVVIIAPESHGFSFGALVADKLNLRLHHVRKRKQVDVGQFGSEPTVHKVFTDAKQCCSVIQNAAMDDTTTCLEVRVFAEKHVVIVDDAVSSGNTVRAIVDLVNLLPGQKSVLGVACGVSFPSNMTKPMPPVYSVLQQDGL